MIARDLEKLLSAAGAAPSKVATIAGELRNRGRLPKAGRGPNAPAISSKEAATLLAAVAGSSRANDAAKRIEKIEQLTLGAAPGAETFLEALTRLLDDPQQMAEVAEVRVARTIGRALIIYKMGQVGEFLGGKHHDLARRFRTVGELPGGLLADAATLLNAPKTVRRKRRRASAD